MNQGFIRSNDVQEGVRYPDVWEGWQDTLRQSFPSTWVAFTATKKDADRWSVYTWAKRLRGIYSELRYTGAFALEPSENGGYHAHGFVEVNADVVEYVVDGLREKLGRIGFCDVAPCRDRVLWARYITKDACVGPPERIQLCQDPQGRLPVGQDQ